MLQAGRSQDRVQEEVNFFNLPNLSSRTMTLGSTQPLIETSTRNFPGGKSGRRLGLTISPTTVCRMSENVGASTTRTLSSSTLLLHTTFHKNWFGRQKLMGWGFTQTHKQHGDLKAYFYFFQIRKVG
jgi:hypothetical protein